MCASGDSTNYRPRKETNLRLRTLIPIICLIAASIIPACAQNPVSGPSCLQYKYKAGDIDKYKIVVKYGMDISIPGMAESGVPGAFSANMSMVSVLRAKVLGVLPDGSAKINFSYESMKMDFDMPGMPGIDKKKMEEMQKEFAKEMPVITALVDKYGVIRGMEGLSKIPGMENIDIGKLFGGQMGFGMGTGSIVFPDGSVSVGDAWTQDIPIFGAGKMTVDSTLESLNTKVGSKVAAKIKQDFSGHIDLADLMKAFMPAMGGNAFPMPAMNGGMDMTGWGVTYVEPTTAKLVRSDADVDMVMNMNASMPAGTQPTTGPQSINLNMKMNMKINMIRLAS